MKIYGYARVSTHGQSVTAQVTQLEQAGAEKIFREVASGAKTDRAQLRRALDQLQQDDVLLVTRLDRLARSTRDLLNTLAAITAKGAGFRSLGDTWADSTTSHGRLMLTVLGGLAEFERDLIRTRTGEGRVRAIAKGVKMGRKPKLTAHQIAEAVKRRDNGKETWAEIARTYNVSHSMISRLSALAKSIRPVDLQQGGTRHDLRCCQGQFLINALRNRWLIKHIPEGPSGGSGTCTFIRQHHSIGSGLNSHKGGLPRPTCHTLTR